MKKYSLVVVMAALLTTVPLFAKPKTKSYNNTAQEVFDAALKTARERHVVTYVDEKNLMFTFATGQSVLSHGFIATASVQPESETKAALIINVQNKGYSDGKIAVSYGAGGRMADKFYEQVEEELAHKSRQKTDGKPEAPHVDVPPSPIAREQVGESGKVTVDSTPQGAEVTVDGAFTGNAPSALSLRTGKHTISVVQAGYKTWSRELSVFSGSESKLNATLSKIADSPQRELPERIVEGSKSAPQGDPSPTTPPEIERHFSAPRSLSSSAESLGIKTQTTPHGGAEIVDIVFGGIADLAALQIGDVIVAVGGKRVRSPMELSAELSNLPAGSRVKLGYLRRGYWQSDTVIVLGSPQ